jgi:hypothetical protein
MFWASSANLQEDTVVHMQHMVLSLCKQVSGRVLLKHDLLDITIYEGWNFNSGNYLFTTDTK